MTTVSIHGDEFWIDGQPTYEGRWFEGHKVQGQLFNVRAVQATFDDANPETLKHWAYPDTGAWDPQRNVDLFCQALPTWRDHGVLGFTINLQGGGPLYVPEIYQAYDNNGFTPEGDLKPDYAARTAQVLARADELGMVVIVGFFYWVFLRPMKGEEAVYRAFDQGLSFLESTGRSNILIELANEVDVIVKNTAHDMFSWERAHEIVLRLRQNYPDFLYSTSGGGIRPDGHSMPSDSFIQVADYVLFHGNGARPDSLAESIAVIKAKPVYQRHPKPLIINEDSPAVDNMEVCWPNGVSWGYFDQGIEKQGDGPWASYAKHPRWADRPLEKLSGFQTPPVNWGINTILKRKFFSRVAQITGAAV